MNRGFTFIEIIIVITVVLVLAAGIFFSLANAQREKRLDTAADGILFTLEEAKADALSGKFGSAHGVHIDEDSYVRFVGSSYDEFDSDNVTYNVPDGITVSALLTGGGDDIVFARLNGSVAASGTVTVQDSEGNSIVITIGALGDVSK